MTAQSHSDTLYVPMLIQHTYTAHVETSGTTCYICICLTTAINQMVNSFQTLAI